MNIASILSECRSHGVTVFLANGKASAKGSREALDRFRSVLKQHKAEVERFLSAQDRRGIDAARAQPTDKPNTVMQSLAHFNFDLMQADIDAGYPADELHRINNMAWEFMQVDRMAFDEAIKLAAEIVVFGQVTACEAAYENVQALFNRMQTHERKA